MTFGQNLKYLREIHHVKQDDLAAYLKVTRSAIAGYETRGKQPDYEKLIHIAKYFNVSVDYLLTGKQTDVPSKEPDSTSLRYPSSIGEPKQSVPETNTTFSGPMRSRRKRA